jgi:predicted Zn-dependent protease
MSMVWTRLALAGALALGFASPLAAMGTEPPPDTPASCKEANKAKCPPSDAKKAKDAAACKAGDKSKCSAKQSFLDKYHAAVALIDAARYDEALAAMREIDDGTSPDVTTYIGYINRKQGKMAEAQMYYEAALHIAPKHRGALEYYGEWYCMMGNVGKARQNLDTIGTLYGRDTKEYAALAKMIDDTAAQKKS